jgi:hypothetical protein
VGVLLGAPWHGCSSLFGPCLHAEHEEEEVEEREERKRKGQKKKMENLLNLGALWEKNKR